MAHEENNYGLLLEPKYKSWLLLQERQTLSAIGLKQVAESYSVYHGKCQHKLILSSELPNYEFLMDLQGISQDPVFTFLSPIPQPGRKQILYLESDNLKDILVTASIQKMLCPREMGVSSVKVSEVFYSTFSNIGVQILTEGGMKNAPHMERHILQTMKSPGKLIILGEKIPRYNFQDFFEFQKLDDRWSDKILYWSDKGQFERLGCCNVTRFMRKEKLLEV